MFSFDANIIGKTVHSSLAVRILEQKHFYLREYFLSLTNYNIVHY